jgi:hypothetical protein
MPGTLPPDILAANLATIEDVRSLTAVTPPRHPSAEVNALPRSEQARQPQFHQPQSRDSITNTHLSLSWLSPCSPCPFCISQHPQSHATRPRVSKTSLARVATDERGGKTKQFEDMNSKYTTDMRQSPKSSFRSSGVGGHKRKAVTVAHIIPDSYDLFSGN